ncbi:MAG TPA: thioredoxin [Dongiaceae bacterium]|jgi:putative thioredoxin
MEQLLGAAPKAGPAGADLIKDSDTEHFMADVMEASQQQPVIVDFWAPWCGPCKQLGPILERVVKDHRGAVKLVKINVDDNQELAMQLRVQSIPAVFGFAKGRPVTAFTGAQPESQIKSFVQRLLQAAGAPAGPSPIEQALTQADEALASGDFATASAVYGQVLSHDPQNAAAIGGYAKCFAAAGEIAEAKKILARATGDLAKHPAVAAAQTAISLAEEGQKGLAQVGEFRARLQKDPKDHQARLDLATALFGGGQREEAVDELLELYRLGRGWNEDAARKQLVKFFEAMGGADPLTISGRRRLSSMMFS